MDKQVTVVVDADAIIAQTNPKDTLHFYKRKGFKLAGELPQLTATE